MTHRTLKIQNVYPYIPILPIANAHSYNTQMIFYVYINTYTIYSSVSAFLIQKIWGAMGKFLCGKLCECIAFMTTIDYMEVYNI